MKPFKLTFLLMPFCVFLNAQQSVIVSEYSYRKYDIEDGLGTSKVLSLGKDADGFIWVGTYSGLSRYDGFKFEPVSSIHFSVLRIEDFGKNDFRAYTSDGYSVVDRQKLIVPKNVFTKQKLYLDFIQSRCLPKGYGLYEDEAGTSKKLCFAKDSNLTIISENSYLDKINRAVYLPFFDEAGKKIYLPFENEYVVVSSKGDLLFGGKGVQFYSFVKWNNEIYAIGIQGIYKETAGKRFELIYPHFFDDDFNGAYAISDEKGRLIIKDATTLYRFANGKLETICSGLSIIREMMFDREGNLWVGTNAGLYNFFNLDFRRCYFKDENKGFSSVFSVRKDSATWLGDYESHFYRIHNNGMKIFSGSQIQHPKNEANLSFSSHPVETDSFAVIPINNNGYYIINQQNIQRFSLDVPSEKLILSSALTPDGKLVLVTSNRVFILTPEGKVEQKFSNENITVRFTDVETDNLGRIWVAGQEHVSLIENGSIKSVPSDQQTTTIMAVKKDAEGVIWFISDNKLFSIKNGKISEVRKLWGSCKIFTITKSGKFVFPTTEGIFIDDPKSKKTVKYDKYNGFTGVEPEQKRISEDAWGNVWVSSLKGLFVFNPGQLLRSQSKPALMFQSVRVSKNNVDWKSVSLDSLDFTHSYKNLIINYLGLSYSLAGNVRYQYRLRGFQDEWSQPIAEREVTFNNLPPGHYVFELKCNAGMPETQTETISLPVYIQPAFWQTWLFKILIFVLLAGVIAWLAIRYQRKKHEKEIRKVNREKEMNELRVQSVRLKSIPHFNSNVLAGIEYFIMTKSKEEANELLTTYSRFTNITLHDIDKAQRTLKDELEYVRMYLGLEKMRYGDKLSYSIDVADDVKQDIMIPNMVLHTFAENAIKHGIRGKNTAGKVQIKVVNENKGIRLNVEDDGVGRTESAKRNAEQNRQGHGLSILTRQIELYNQQNEEKIEQKVVDLTDENGNPTGTRFEMVVPYGYKYI